MFLWLGEGRIVLTASSKLDGEREPPKSRRSTDKESLH
jgi:hypothetical protein